MIDKDYFRKHTTLIRASQLISVCTSIFGNEIKELKWEGPVHIWWEAAMQDAKNRID